MSTKIAISKNIKLSQEVVSFIQENPKVTKGFPSNATIIVTKSNDKDLDIINGKVLASIKEEGKPIITAQKNNNNKKNPWSFSLLTF